MESTVYSYLKSLRLQVAKYVIEKLAITVNIDRFISFDGLPDF